jgi:hypothetical protein
MVGQMNLDTFNIQVNQPQARPSASSIPLTSTPGTHSNTPILVPDSDSDFEPSPPSTLHAPPQSLSQNLAGTIKAVKPLAVSSHESHPKYPKRSRITCTSDEDGTDNNETDNDADCTDSEYEELIYGSMRAMREGLVQMKDWIDMCKQLDDILKQEKVKHWLLFSQVILIHTTSVFQGLTC